MVGQKAMTFGPSAKRLIRRMAPEKVKAVAVISLAVVSVVLTAFGPKILGHATDLIFAGFAGEGFPDGLTKEQAVDAVRARGDGQKADMLASMDFVPGRGVDFSAVANVLLLVLGGVRRGLAAGVAPGLSPQRRRPEHGVPDALGGGGQGQRPAARLLRPAAARRAALPRHQRHRQREPGSPADDEPADDLIAHRGGGAVDDDLDQPHAGPGRTALGAAHDAGRRSGDETVAGPVRGAVASYRHAQRAHRGVVLRATTWSRSSAGRRRSRRSSRGRTTSCSRRRSEPSSSPG